MVIEPSNRERTSNQNLQDRRIVRNIPRAQETIYRHLIAIVKAWPPDDVLQEFDHLFIQHSNTVSSDMLPSLYEIVFANREDEFRNTLKRSCYILINNWDISRNHDSIQKLVQLFSNSLLHKPTVSPTLRRLRSWLRHFVASDDYRQLCLFAARYDEKAQQHWSDRYVSYLLVPQYTNLSNSVEQRRAARELSKKLKEQFKFDLAMYTARSQSLGAIAHPAKNPTRLGDDVLRLIKVIVVRKGQFSYANLASIFRRQTRQQKFRDFKTNLLNYLLFALERNELREALRTHLWHKLTTLYQNHDEDIVNDALTLRTCNRVIEFLTTEDHVGPSPLFVQLLADGNPLTLVVVLLKVVLACRYARTHLDARIADLVKYYRDLPEQECQWVINFFEIFDITMAIHAENVEFNLVNMDHAATDHATAFHFTSIQPRADAAEWDGCRIFSQVKSGAGTDAELDALEQKMLETLSADILDELA
jgi:hypothetical protein